MSNIVRVTLVLSGRMAGKTALLNTYQFDDGELTLEGGREQIENLMRYFERTYQAYPKGDARIAALNKACADADATLAAEKQADNAAEEGAPDGERDIQSQEGSGDSKPLSSDVQPDGTGTSEEAAGAGSSDAPGETGAEGSLAGGDRHQDPRISREVNDETDRRTREAVAALSHDNDDHWTPEGDPAISAVEELMGEGGVTRDSINAVAMGYTREIASEPIGEGGDAGAPTVEE